MHLIKLLKTTVCFLVITNSFPGSMYAQDVALLKQLEQSQYLRSVMKVDSADAGMTRWSKKKVEH